MPIDDEAWARARRAKTRLEKAMLHDSAVTLIDIGVSRSASLGEGAEELVLRVHVRGSSADGAPDVPDSVDGVPVRIMPGDYRLEGE